jgi:hypothetical protein
MFKLVEEPQNQTFLTRLKAATARQVGNVLGSSNAQILEGQDCVQRFVNSLPQTLLI